MWKKVAFCITILSQMHSAQAIAQDKRQNFRNTQFASTRVTEAWKKYSDTLMVAFERQDISYPPKNILLRAFKSQNELELWAENESGQYKLIKTYKICSVSGSLGPKRSEGDRQVPEGFYFIDNFNPASAYYMSLSLTYPNYADKKSSSSSKLGGGIYIHGGCVTVGCLPMTDEGIKELYTVCLSARLNGEEHIPVHIYPTRLSKNGMNYLSSSFPNDAAKQKFWEELKGEYDYFEKYHRLLPVMYTADGKYAY